MRNLTISLNNNQLKLLDSVLGKDESYYEFCKKAILKMIDTRCKHKSTSTRSEGVGHKAQKPSAAPAVGQPGSDAPKDKGRKKRSKKGITAPQRKPRKGSLDSFVEA